MNKSGSNLRNTYIEMQEYIFKSRRPRKTMFEVVLYFWLVKTQNYEDFKILTYCTLKSSNYHKMRNLRKKFQFFPSLFIGYKNVLSTSYIERKASTTILIPRLRKGRRYQDLYILLSLCRTCLNEVWHSDC